MNSITSTLRRQFIFLTRSNNSLIRINCGGITNQIKSIATIQRQKPILFQNYHFSKNPYQNQQSYSTISNNQEQDAPKETKGEDNPEIDSKDKSTSEIEQKDKQIAELKDSYLRCLAEMENLRVRTRREIDQKSDFAIQKFATDVLNTLDNLRLALNSVPPELRTNTENSALVSLYSGLSLTESELFATLKRYGIEEINPIGEKFDPNIHEAVYQEVVPGKEVGTVSNVQKVGYILKGRIIRPSQVFVVKEEEGE
ncbi:2883_t:CDS:2 [Entrophospora sp. SA101]|nr:14893_t:CDS:2 [Entrophospora sp. SA101]CAJ0629925.1 10546_t:CDS:2 [Entrophospora sp. SA101]CAJ0756431.1 8120_t:CDS:2 [Entrophospora sp. SA101]CAJ0766583.1 2883_t:CDS:2 [Entrophospora sp. SA101]CAJ0844666.1 12053_t:CDS:2 [Entrophospora sp. SA101]